MNTAAKQLKDYRAPEYLIETTELDIEIGQPFTTVKNTMKIIRQSHANPDATLVLNGEHQKLLSVLLNGSPLSDTQYHLDENSLQLNTLPASFTLTISSQCDPNTNTALEGLYRSDNMLCTQCEAHGFRRITYYLDRPDVMSVFTTKITADKTLYPILLSNGNKIKNGTLEGNRHYVIWQDPFKKPCYLFALVAGNLALREGTFTTQSGRSVSLQVYTRYPDFEKSMYAIEALQDAMRWDETTYGREYDLDTYIIVAVSDFNMGAMENKGLNVFNTKYVLVSPTTATDHDYRQVQAVIGHEYFHNWTGNRITCRDWFQLSLKEGLTVFRDQQFTADYHSATVKRIEDVKIIRSAQFSEDASPMAHPIRPSSYVEINNFYTVTVYNKGAEIIRMMHTLVGASGFRKGMDLYFARHDGQAVTCDDYVAAIADANQIDLTQFKRWYSQAGTPTVHVQDHYDPDTQTYTLTLSQSCPPTADHSPKEPFYIPIKLGLIGATGQDLPLTNNTSEIVLTLNQPTQTVTFHPITERPTPSLLRDFSAPVKLDYAFTDAQLNHLFSHDSNEFNRWDSGQKLASRLIFAIMNALRLNQSVPDTQGFVEAIEHTLWHTELDPALVAEAITLPAESLLIQDLPIIWVEPLHQARNLLLDQIAQRLKALLLDIYQRSHLSGDYQRDPMSCSKRKLKNACLSYLSRLPDPDITKLCQQQFADANNMTDQLAALYCLVNGHDEDARLHTLEKFYQQWQQEALVVDKWLAIQATADLPDTLTHVQMLEKHPGFTPNNPNKVYALVGGFNSNHAHFHQATGKGYQWLAEQVKQLDKNPQVAARMVRGLMNFRRYDQHRQTLMKQALEDILRTPHLSKDVYEIVSKSLE